MELLDSSIQATAETCGLEEAVVLQVMSSTDALLARGRKELNMRDPEWKTPQGQAKIQAGYAKELNALIKETGAWVPVPVEDSHRLRTLCPERILTPRPVITLRVNDLDEEEVKCRLTIQGFQDPDLTTLHTEAPTLARTSRHFICQVAASSKWILNNSDIQNSFPARSR